MGSSGDPVCGRAMTTVIPIAVLSPPKSPEMDVGLTAGDTCIVGYLAVLGQPHRLWIFRLLHYSINPPVFALLQSFLSGLSGHRELPSKALCGSSCSCG